MGTTWPTDFLVLWHGTDDAAAAAIIASGAKAGANFGPTLARTCDFGIGFYTTTHRRLASDWANRKASLPNRSGTAKLVRFEIPILDFAGLPKMAFGDGGPSASLFWTFVMACRAGVQYHHNVKGWNFPAVVGPVSASVAPDYGSTKVVPDADQISFHAPDGLKFLNRFPGVAEDP